jgi:hypothetical protein
MTVGDALRNLTRADDKLKAAEVERREAEDALERALAEHGWTRLRGAFYPGATALYVHDGLSAIGPQTRVQVLDHLARQKAAA